MTNNKIITVTLNPCIDKTIELNNFKTGMVNRTLCSRIDAGGKGINVSRVLSDSDSSSLALGIVGGMQGRILENILTNENVCFDFVQAEGETRTNLKIYDRITKTTTDINEPGFEISGKTLNMFYEKLVALLPQSKILVLAGSVPPQCDNSVYASIIKIAKEYNVKVILDADGELLKKGIDAVPSVIKPNIHELESLYGKNLCDEKDIISAMKDISDKGVELIALSLGKDGAMFYNKGKIIKAKALDVNVKSAVGCGDSMVAAISYAMINNFDLPSLAKTSVAAGSLTAAKEGTNVCTVKEAIDAASKVEIQTIAQI